MENKKQKKHPNLNHGKRNNHKKIGDFLESLNSDYQKKTLMRKIGLGLYVSPFVIALILMFAALFIKKEWALAPFVVPLGILFIILPVIGLILRVYSNKKYKVTEIIDKYIIHSYGSKTPGQLHEEVGIEVKDGKYYYYTLSQYDRMHTGGNSARVPDEFVTEQGLNIDGLLAYIAKEEPYMESLQHKNTEKSSVEMHRCARCRKEISADEAKRIGNHIFCQKCGSPYQGKSVIPGNTFSNTTSSYHAQNFARIAEAYDGGFTEFYLDLTVSCGVLSITETSYHYNANQEKHLATISIPWKLNSTDEILRFICSKSPERYDVDFDKLKKNNKLLTFIEKNLSVAVPHQSLPRQRSDSDAVPSRNTDSVIALIPRGSSLKNHCAVERFELIEKSQGKYYIDWSVSFGNYPGSLSNPGASGMDVQPICYFENADAEGFAKHLEDRYYEEFGIIAEKVLNNPQIQVLFSRIKEQNEANLTNQTKEEYCIQQLFEPSHVGETEHGYSLVKKGTRFYIKHSMAYAKPSSSTQYYEEIIPLPEEVQTFDELYSYNKEQHICHLPYYFCGNENHLSHLFRDKAQNVEFMNLIYNDNFKNTIESIKEYRNVYGYGMGQERELTVLYFSSQTGYFYIQQRDSNAGTFYRWLLLPKNISNYDTYYIEHEDEFSGWISGWYSNKFKSDMTR